MIWSEQQIETLKALWRDGFSASETAALIGGISRNAVIGKVHRLGLELRGNQSSKLMVRDRIAKAKGKSRARKSPINPVTMRHKPVVIAPDPIEPLNIPLDQLEFGLCHQVTLTTEWGKPRYCGHVAHLGSRFCAGHHARNYVEIAPKPRKRVTHEYSRREDFRESARWGAR